MEKIIADDKLVDELMEDWLDRDGDTFVYAKSKGRLGWEHTLDDGDAYSTYLSDSLTTRDLIKKAYSIAKDMIVAMDTPFKIYIRISNHSGLGATDGKYVYVATKIFDNKDFSANEKLDIFLGITIHEGCHLLYTDFSFLRKIPNRNVSYIFNIIEDERIERLCGEHKPGLANFLMKAKYYAFEYNYLREAKKREDTMTPYERLLSCFFKIIRYPKFLTEKEIVDFAPYIKKIKDVALPYPKTTSDAATLAQKVYDIIKELYEDMEEESTDDDSTSEDSEGSSSSEDSSTKESKSSKESKKFSEDASAVSEILEKLTPVAAESKLSSEDMSKEASADSGLLGEECEGLVSTGDSKDTYFSRATEDKIKYNESLDRVRRYVPAVSKIMKGHCKEYKLIHRSMRSGILDSNKLVEAIQGVPTVYIREGAVHTDKITVGVLIDESGSMEGRRISAARDAAVLINEALCNQPNVELFIYGHSGDIRKYGATELIAYREKGFKPRYALGTVKARSQNRDGIAILEASRRIRKQTKNPIILFVLSDGAPCAYLYMGERAMAHVKDSVHKAEQLGVQIIQVCINHSYDPSKMFKNFVILDDMSTLAFELSKAIKRATLLASKIHVE